MRYSSTTSVVLALFAIKEVFGGPTHNHLHRKLHQKRDLKNETPPIVDTPSVIDAHQATDQDSEPSSDSKTGHKSKPHDPKFPDKTKPDHESESSDKSKPDSSKHGSSAKLWKNLVGASNNRKVFGMSTPTYGKEVGYVSNVGIPEGSNMIKVNSAEDYSFTNQFINISEEPMTVVIWNKAASPGLQDPMNANPNLGASIAPEHPALTLALEPQESQTVAFLDESVIGWAQACETRAMSGGFQTTWGEAQFNTTGSGYDVSAIQNAEGSSYIMHISSIEASSCESTESKNMWVTDTSTVGSGSCYIAQKTAHLITKMGGHA
ncbi:putative allergen asp f 4 [Erysiphe neolycopersici]|uniref:Putative allergen asp f 4 n=1 Tax=Erysiphe neolycopersici TaxID=212602 RepID=A0A420HRJ5_9PEZI|nr:putative allergen asp f 4 [Erysiphe neolycopersici]